METQFIKVRTTKDITIFTSLILIGVILIALPTQMGVTIAGATLAIIGIATATIMYMKGQNKVTLTMKVRSKKFIQAAYHRFYMDELWLFVTKKVIFRGISRPIAWFDKHAIDAFMDLLGSATQTFARQIRTFQSGNIQSYCIWFLHGVMILALILIFLV